MPLFSTNTPWSIQTDAGQRSVSHLFQLDVNREWTVNSTCPFAEDTGHFLHQYVCRLPAIKKKKKNNFLWESNVMIIDPTMKHVELFSENEH